MDNKIDCARLETAFLKYKKMLGDNNEDSPLWYWLFESAIKCNEYEMARKVIQEMSAKAENKDEKDDLGYHILMGVIKVMAETRKSSRFFQRLYSISYLPRSHCLNLK
ncbi:MAG: hypothetical protein U9P70_00725 [Patescibacteria group bacterium]|nr:hypothetical protein [Patescibacteria group bacterium]